MMALVLVMGIPGSGKTTLSKKIVNLLGDNALRISFDEVFSYCRVTGDYGSYSMLGYHGYDAYTSHARTERKACEAMIRDGLEMMKREGKFFVPPYESISWNLHNSFIIIDDIFYLQSMRRPFEKMARAYSLSYIVVFVDTPLSVALKWNSGRPSKIFIPEGTIRRLHEQMELPSNDTGNFIKYGINDSVGELIGKLKNCSLGLKPAVKVKIVQPNNLKTEHSKWDNLECDLRRCIGELIREKKSQDLASALRVVKKEVVKDFRARGVEEWKEVELKELLFEKASSKLTNC